MLLNLVPVNESLLAEVLFKNEDIGFVQKGQAVQLKVAAYPFQKYGLLQGRVQTLAPDAQPAQAPTPATSPGQASAPQGYRALIQLNTQRLQDLPLDAGMQVVAEIHQGRRSVMEYLLSPLKQVAAQAGRER